VKQQPSVRREELFDGDPGELVPKGDPVGRVGEYPGREAFFEAVGDVSGQGLEEPELDVRGRDRDRVQQCRGGRAQARGAGKDGVANGMRELRLSRG
jgi:hypothetical protein